MAAIEITFRHGGQWVELQADSMEDALRLVSNPPTDLLKEIRE